MMKNEKKRRDPEVYRLKFFQVVCWGCMILAQVSLIHCLDTKAMAGSIDRMEIRSEWYDTEDACPDPPEIYDSGDGLIYKRKSWEIVQDALPAKEEIVEREVSYEQVEGMTPIPEITRFTVTEDGREGTVRAQAEEVRVLRETWSRDFAFPVTFHSCDAEYCQLGDQMIPYQEERPALDGYEYLLLDIIGAPQEVYRILDVRWDGDIYVDASGIPCRDAIASGEKLVRDYQVLYRGMAEFPACERWQTVTVYELPREEETDELQEMKEEAAVILDDADFDSNAGTDLPLWKKIIRTVSIIMSLLVPILILLMIILVKRRKACYTEQKERKTKPHRRTKDS